MQEREQKKQAIEGVLDAGKAISIPVMPKNIFQKFLQKIGLKKKSLTFTLRKIRVGNRERIGIVVDKFPKGSIVEGNMLRKIMELSKEHTSDLIYCAAVALQNDANEPSEDLLDALRWVDDELLYSILQKSFEEVDAKNFLNSIVLVIGTESLMKTESK